MAQTGFTPIQLYFSSTTTNVPLAANLASGELAINITDGKLFYKDNANAVQVIGWKVVPATAGGTGQTSYAVGDLLYADTTTSLAKLPDVATGNALISGGVGVAPSWGKIGLTTHVSGILPLANGGTNNATGAATAVTSNSTSGVLQITGPAAASTRVMTVPDANFTAARTDAAQTFTGVQTFNGNIINGSATAPTFSAYRATSSQSISNATFTKVQLNTEEWDTANCFDSTTNYRFTPTVAGYYQVSGCVNYDPAASGKFFCVIYKNGATYKGGTSVPFVATQFLTAAVSALVYFDGSTDYVELYTFQSSGGSLTLYDSQTFTFFQAAFVRSA
jgi:hypothetical protein